MKIGIVYFSATGNTKAYAKIIGEEMEKLGVHTFLLDITTPKVRDNLLNFDDFEAVLFGFPIYSFRAPRIIRDWLSKLSVNQKKCAMFFTYGGASPGVAHVSTKQILESRGFKVIASAEFLGAHSFNCAKGWDILPDRPNQADFDMTRQYAFQLIEKLRMKDPSDLVLGSSTMTMKLLDQIEAYPFIIITQLPTRNGQECSMCLTCETQCPSGAFNATLGEADPNKCILCMRCITTCPDNILQINELTEACHKLRKRQKLTDNVLSQRESKFFM